MKCIKIFGIFGFILLLGLSSCKTGQKRPDTPIEPAVPVKPSVAKDTTEAVPPKKEVVPLDKIDFNDTIRFTPQKTITKIVLHCSATKEGRDLTVEKINDMHQRDNGWDAIGYHYVIYRDGSIHKGRPDNVKGAHAYGANTNSIGICYIGGLDENGKAKDTRTDAQKKSMHQLVDSILRVYPQATVHGHYEYAKKDCPCFDVSIEF